jgi:hypothetical protein
MEEQREVVEYEPPRSVASSPPTTPGTPLRSQLSNGNLPAAATANPGGSVGGTSVSTTPAASTGYAAPRAVPVSPAAPLLPASHSPAHTPVPAVAAAVLSPSASNVHASVNLLDMDDGPAPSASAPRLTLIECAGRFTPVLFQQLWGRLSEAYNGQICALSRRPGSTAELEAALRSQKVLHDSSLMSCAVFLTVMCLPQVFVMASGPLPPGGSTTGLKLFVYAVGRPAGSTAGPDMSFLAQVVQVNETGTVSAVVKTDATALPATEAATQFVSLVLASLSSFGPR